MKKLLTTTFLTMGIYMSLINGAFASSPTASVNYKIPNPSKYDSLEEVISAIASLIRPIFVISFGALILYGAGQVMFSRGDDAKITNGKQTIIAAGVGFIIAVLAPTIANFIISLLGVEGFSF